MEANIISVPLPVLAAVLCAILAPLMWRLDLGRRAAAVCFALLFADFAVQSLLVGLRFGYGVEQFIPLQRVLPLSVGPLLYLGFNALALPRRAWRRSAVVHLGTAAALAVLLSAFADIYRDFDLVISASYLVYTFLLIRLWRRGQDHLIYAKLDVARAALRWMLCAVALLLVLLALDTAIALSFALSQGNQAPALVTFGSALLIAALLLILTRMPAPRPQPAAPYRASDQQDPHSTLEAQARAMLTRSRLYLDPDLTVQRLARRLSVPERALSAAINQHSGMNVSQYVNSFRLEHAATLLRDSAEPVTQVMSQSGFLTRSNFYKEFQRIYGQSPASYRADQQVK